MDAILDYPLTIVEAPMGYGKTTAVKESLGKAAVNVLWQRIYNGDTDSFWNGFTRLFQELDKDCYESLIRLGFPGNSVSMREALNLLERIALPYKTVLVIDDYHLIDRPDVDGFIVFLTENSVNNFHIVLTARFTNIPRLEELQLKGFLHHITQETFELKPSEIKEYYITCGIILNDTQVQRLYSSTEGWISALYLFMLEYISNGSLAPAESIYKLIEKTIYIPLSNETKEFIMDMSIFDSFTYEQAKYVWGKDTTGGFLAKLTESNSFVQYDRKLKTYHIHSIFNDFLREELYKKEPSYRNELYSRAGEWFMKAGDYSSARSFFYVCGNYDGILLALEAGRTLNISFPEKDLLKKYMAQCPNEIKSQHHYALLVFALQLFVYKELELFNKTCGELTSNIENDKALSLDERNHLLGELELLLSFAEFNDLKKMAARHQKAWQLLNQPTTIYTAKTNWTFGSPSVLCLYYRESGKLDEHIRDIKAGMPDYCRLTGGHGSGAEYAMEAESLFNQGEFENAEISAQKALLKAQSENEENIVISAQYMQILIAFIKGELPMVIALMKKMREGMGVWKDFIHTVEICEGCIFSYLDQIDKIPEKLLEINLSSLRLTFPAYAFFNVMYGRILLIKGDYLKLLGSEDYFISVASVFHNLIGFVYTYIYLAAANIRIFREDEALVNLKKALEIALPDRQYMPFVQNCDYIKPLLERLAGSSSFGDSIARILSLYNTFQSSKERIISEYFKVEKPRLTDREAEIAYLAASEATNAEIGRQLYISENTVKTALRGIYAKLSINSRQQLQQYFNNLT